MSLTDLGFAFNTMTLQQPQTNGTWTQGHPLTSQAIRVISHISVLWVIVHLYWLVMALEPPTSPTSSSLHIEQSFICLSHLTNLIYVRKFAIDKHVSIEFDPLVSLLRIATRGPLLRDAIAWGTSILSPTKLWSFHLPPSPSFLHPLDTIVSGIPTLQFLAFLGIIIIFLVISRMIMTHVRLVHYETCPITF